MSDRDRSIYIVISQTGTLLSRMIGVFSHDQYNHASISTDESLRVMYSFGRKHAYNPLIGGFVMESPFFGTFKRFSQTRVIVIRVPVTCQQEQALNGYLQAMYRRKDMYVYNFPGLVFAAFGIYWRHENWYYCSEFICETLDRFHILDRRDYADIVKPEDFFNIPDKEVVFEGYLQDYARNPKFHVRTSLPMLREKVC